jgi:hypothetical protein
MAQRTGFGSDKGLETVDIDTKHPINASTTGFSSSSDSHHEQEKRGSIIEEGVPSYLPEDDHFGEAHVLETAEGTGFPLSA